MRAVLIGNYGVANLGDEALREYFLRSFPQVEWLVLSADPQDGEYPRLPFGLRSIFRPWWRTLHAYAKVDAVVFGGGSLFTDVESIQACFLWWWHALWAVIMHKKIYLAFQGVGPFRTHLGERLTAWVLRRAAFISVRDEASLGRVRFLASNRKVIQTFDPVFSLFGEQNQTIDTKNVIALVPRLNSGKTFEEIAQKAIESTSHKSVEVWLFEPHNPMEQGIGQRLALRFGATVVPCLSVEAVQERLRTVTHMVTQRYHAGLFAFGAGCPVTIVPQKDGDKLSALAATVARPGAAQEAQILLQNGQKALQEALAVR